MDINAMAKQECYSAFMRLVDKQNLNGQRKLAKALNIRELAAKDLLNGNTDDCSQDQLIKYTAALIHLRLTNGTP